MKFHKFVPLVVASLFIIFVGAPGNVAAQEAEKEAGWKFAVELYLWGASIGGETTSGSPISVDFRDLTDKLNAGFMGAVAARKGKWTLLADVIYLDVGENTTVGPGPGINLGMDLTGFVVNSGVGYSFVDTEKGRIIVLGGVRYLNLDLDLALGPLKGGDSGSNWDGIVGAKGIYNLTENWYLAGYLDVGTGDSNVTWQGIGGMGYRFKKWFELNAGYRYLSWDFQGQDTLADLNFQGPFAGLLFRF